MRIVFMGTPQFAVPALRKLLEQWPVAGAVTQPDRPAGRGRQPAAGAVKLEAQRCGLPVISPARLRDATAHAQIVEWAPDLIVVAAYGQLLSSALLQLPTHGCLNIHASLLPRHRGAAPVAAAILAGDKTTGVSIMRMDAGLDTGAVLEQRILNIRPDHDGGSLTQELAALGAETLCAMLPAYLEGKIKAVPQDAQFATYAPQLTKKDGLLDFGKPAFELALRVRAMQPWPSAHFLWNGAALKVLAARAIPGSAIPGRVIAHAAGAAIGTGQDWLLLEVVQPAGKRAMPIQDFLNGNSGFVGSEITVRI
jgi:methionyl-tRNA formyltransferase